MGDRLGYLQQAVRMLGETGGIAITGFSPVYETVPVGGPPQGEYLNAVAAVKTALGPQELFRACRDIESRLGRERAIPRGPRTIDIDILLYGDAVIQVPDLVVPHPRMAVRGFVLYPLVDLAPEVIHPVLGVSLGELRDRIGGEGIRLRKDLVLNLKTTAGTT